MRLAAALALASGALVAACSGGGSPGSPPPPSTAAFLTVDDVQRVIAQAVGEAQARGLHAQVAVVDRVGNVLAIFAMDGANTSTRISSGLGVAGGLEGVGVSTMDAAVSKAITAAYLSSNGNAFTTRTANQIIQVHFDPDESQQPSGPLYGVQFSQLACSDVIEATPLTTFGPRPSPLGLAADPGGVPLYKDGVLVGGIGVEADNVYGIDQVITDVDASPEEAVAVAGSFRFEAPDDVRANRITADGRTLRFVDSIDLASNPAQAPAFASLPGALAGLVPYNLRTLSAGQAFGTGASGMRPASAAEPNGAWILVDAANANRYPVRPGTDGRLAAAEVDALLAEAIAVARRARGQIRRPLGSSAEVTVSVVDSNGSILGLVRTPDAPVFGIDVAVQKARTAAAFSGGGINAFFATAAAADFVGAAFDGTIAWTSRAIGNLHRPTFPDGIEATPAGPFSTPLASWSPFNVGLQLDLVIGHLSQALSGETSKGCVEWDFGGLPPARATQSGIANGIQIFPGGVPIYRGSRLVGAIGVSGDGVDQDDMVAFLGLANAGRNLPTGLGNAPTAMRADTLAPLGNRLRYVQCPQAPFNGSTDQNVCAGL